MKHKQQTHIEQVIKNTNRADDLGTADANADTNADIKVNKDRVTNQGIDIKGATGSNRNGKSQIIYLKIVSFSINNITSHNYSMQLKTEIIKLIKNLLVLK